MQKQALITGITGQDGTFLTKLLLEKGYKIFGVVRDSSNFANFKGLGLKDTDITKIKFDEIRAIVEDDFEIYNFAAQSSVAESWKNPKDTFSVNLDFYINLIEQVKHKKVKIMQASSAEIFESSEDLITEDSQMNPKNPYSVSKYAAHKYGQLLRESQGINISNAILFNHESELRPLNFLSKKITTHVAKLKKGSNEILEVGNLNAVRDWGFAGDYVDAMHKLLEGNHFGDFVIATGVKHTVRDFIQICFEQIGIELRWEGSELEEKAFDTKNNQKRVEVNQEFYRPNDSKFLVGNNSKTKSCIEFTLDYNLRDLIKRMTNFEIVSSEE